MHTTLQLSANTQKIVKHGQTTASKTFVSVFIIFWSIVASNLGDFHTDTLREISRLESKPYKKEIAGHTDGHSRK